MRGNNMIRTFSVILYLLVFATVSFAQDSTATKDSTGAREQQPKYLHISTNPSYADVYINNTKPKHSSTPDYELPGFIEVPAGQPDVVITIFRPEYADTSINVHLSAKDTSFLIVSLRPHYDDKISNKQYSEVSHRHRKQIGHKLLWGSIVPFMASGISALVSKYNIERANDTKKQLKNTLIHNENQYQQSIDKFNDYRDNAKQAKNIATFGTVLGGIVFTTGLILSF